MMTDTHTTTEGAPRQNDRLERPVEGRVVAGVAEGLARRLGIGTGWVRLAFVLATLFGGSGILAYVVGWLLMPDEREDESVLQRYVGNVGDWSSWIGIALIGLAALIVIDQTGLISGELLFAAVLIGLGILLYRGQLPGRPPEAPLPSGGGGVRVDDPPQGEDPPEADAGPEATTDEAPPVDSTAEAPEFDNPEFDPDDPGDGGGQAPPPPAPVAKQPREPRPPRPRREPSYLGRLTVATALIVIGGIGAYDAGSAVDVAYGVYFASFMIVIGAGLLVGAWVGRARWLVIPGLVLLPLFVAVSVLPGPLSGDIGERDVSGVQVIAAGGVEEMAIGDFFVDLRDIPPGTNADLSISLGIGQLVVIVPDDRTVELDAEVGMGELVINNASTGGLGLERSRVFGDGEPELSIRADLGIGQLEVRRLDASSFGNLPGFDCEPTSPDWPFAGELVCIERTN